MKSGFRRWSLLAAIALLALGIKSFVQRYPGGRSLGSDGKNGPMVRDTVWPAVLRFSATASDSALDASDTAPVPDPFRQRFSPSPAVTPKASVPPPARKWKLKGTAGDAVATVLDSIGTKHLLRAGDSLGGARVLEVHANRVLMRDAAGSFELDLEQ